MDKLSNMVGTMFRRLKTLIFMSLMHLPMSGTMRGRRAVVAGIRLMVPDGEKPHLFVGENVRLDHLNPQGIEIGNWTTLATGCVVLSHYLSSELPPVGFTFVLGMVRIGHACFIGANAVICNSVTIGDNSIVGAGSIVTKDIPANEIWGGNPAKFIRKRH